MADFYAEEKLLTKLTAHFEHKAPSADKDEAELRRLRRKLAVRKSQRQRGIQRFSLCRQLEVEKPTLDASASSSSSSEAFLVPSPVTRSVVSSFTGKTLKPFIRRTLELRPPKIRLHEELLSRFPNSPQRVRYPIDFCYVQRQHIAAINRLAADAFWPGVDVAEALDHPDFSCVVLHRKTVVAFAFLLLSVSHVEAYLTFLYTRPEFRGAGIAKFILYHLIQSCSSRDIVLHVSADNAAAVLLYQSFGFKIEERVSDFYDKYLPPDCEKSKHALFLRLSR